MGRSPQDLCQVGSVRSKGSQVHRVTGVQTSHNMKPGTMLVVVFAIHLCLNLVEGLSPHDYNENTAVGTKMYLVEVEGDNNGDEQVDDGEDGKDYGGGGGGLAPSPPRKLGDEQVDNGEDGKGYGGGGECCGGGFWD